MGGCAEREATTVLIAPFRMGNQGQTGHSEVAFRALTYHLPRHKIAHTSRVSLITPYSCYITSS